MTGRGHAITGFILAADTYLCHWVFKQVDSAVIIPGITNFIDKHLDVYAHQELLQFQICMGALSFAFLLIGVLLPDIDTTGAITAFTKYHHLPIPHRGVTHTLYFALLFWLAGVFLFYPLRFIAVGCIIHDIFDSFSKAGWVPFYPFGSHYLSYGMNGNRIVVSKHSHLVLYKSDGGRSEDIFLGIFFGINVIIAVCLIVCFGGFDFSKIGINI